MGLALLPRWANAAVLHDRVRVSNGPPSELLKPDVNVVHMRRCSPVHPRHLRRQALELGVGFRERVAFGGDPGASAAQLTRTLSAGEAREWIQDDVTHLLQLFQEELGVPSGRAVLEVLYGTPCPRFHADHVGVRLLVTYCGPGTVFVENRHVKRRWLWGDGGGGVAVAAVDAAAAAAAGEGDLLFLKGHAWPGNYGMGAVHRSPNMPSVGDPPVASITATSGQAAHGGARYGGSGGAGSGDGGAGVRLLLTIDDVALPAGGDTCGCGRAHGEGDVDAHRADASLVQGGGGGPQRSRRM